MGAPPVHWGHTPLCTTLFGVFPNASVGGSGTGARKCCQPGLDTIKLAYAAISGLLYAPKVHAARQVVCLTCS